MPLKYKFAPKSDQNSKRKTHGFNYLTFVRKVCLLLLLIYYSAKKFTEPAVAEGFDLIRVIRQLYRSEPSNDDWDHYWFYHYDPKK